MKHTAHTKSPRIEVVDALRGFAVMAILLVHCLEHFIYPVYPDPDQYPAWLNILDQGINSVTFSLFAGKAYAIFALLFGFTFYIQYTNQQNKGKDFGVRFVWRLFLLIGFATLNAAFFPGGDVLLLFALVGLILVVVRKWSNKAVLITAILFLLQPVEWFHYFAGLFNPQYSTPDLGVGSLYGEVTTVNKSGDFFEFIKCNATTGQKASLYWAIEAGRTFQTAGLFLLGLLLGRKQLFVPSELNNKFWIHVLIIAAVLFAPLYQLKVELAVSSSELIKQNVATILDMWQKLSFTLILVSSFVLLYNNKERFRALTVNLRFYGRMSLTNYITQSILGALIFFPFALNLAPYCGHTFSILIGFVLLFVQISFCKYWLKSHKQGPLELIWHKLTWILKK